MVTRVTEYLRVPRSSGNPLFCLVFYFPRRFMEGENIRTCILKCNSSCLVVSLISLSLDKTNSDSQMLLDNLRFVFSSYLLCGCFDAEFVELLNDNSVGSHISQTCEQVIKVDTCSGCRTKEAIFLTPSLKTNLSCDK